MGRQLGVPRGFEGPSKSRLIKGMLIVILVNLILTFSYGRVMAGSYFGNTVTEGLKVNGVLVGGLNREEVMSVLQQMTQTSSDPKVTVMHDGQKTVTSYNQIGIVPDLEQTREEIMQYGKVGGPQDRYREISQARNGSADLFLRYRVEDNKAEEWVKHLARNINRDPLNASLQVSPAGKILLTEEKSGKLLDQDHLQAELMENEWNGQELSIDLRVKTIEPEIKAAQLRTMIPTGIIASTTTSFDPTNVTRKENLRVAASMLNNKIFAPGEVISFNETVGPRVLERGFREANVILNGKFVPGIGGGVCQVSSTLYNSALKADMEIVKRSNHSLKVGYLPAGLDATVADNAIDFKFKNNSSGYILLKAGVKGSALTITIYGIPEQKKSVVKILTEILSTTPHETVRVPATEMFEGQEKVVQKGQPGYKVRVTREVYREGLLAKREVISTDRYAAQKRIINVGVRPLE